MFCQARQHILVSGRGTPVIAKQSPRWRIDLNQLDHFLDLITSPYVVQDLPFGERLLKLSTGEVVQTPNVIAEYRSADASLTNTYSTATK